MLRFCLLPICLTGCAFAVPVGPAGPDPSPTFLGEGVVPENEILVYRGAEMGLVTNVATQPDIRLDQRSIGTCRADKPILIRVPDGTWTITAMTRSGEVVREVTVRGGERASLKCGTSPVPSLTPAPTLVPVSPETARAETGL